MINKRRLPNRPYSHFIGCPPILCPLMSFRFLVQDPVLGQSLHSLVLSLWGPLIWKSGLTLAFLK